MYQVMELITTKSPNIAQVSQFSYSLTVKALAKFPYIMRANPRKLFIQTFLIYSLFIMKIVCLIGVFYSITDVALRPFKP